MTAGGPHHGKSEPCVMAWPEVCHWGFPASEGAKDTVTCYPFCGILMTFPDIAFAFLSRVKKTPAPPGAKQTLSELVCTDSWDFLLTVY